MVANELAEYRVPDELAELNQWVLWDYQQNDNGKQTKIPKQANHHNARSNDPRTWTTFESAVEASPNFQGPAFVFTSSDPYCGVDLDNCIDEDGNFRDWALPILAKFQHCSFIEISPSGSGIKCITKGTKPEHSGCQVKVGDDKQQIECYHDGRYWTITGDIYAGCDSIGDGQEAVTWLCETYLTAKRPEPSPVEPTFNPADAEKASEALQHIGPDRADLYDDWLRVGLACKSIDASLRDDWVAWSRRGDGFVSDADCLKKWAQLKPNGKLGLGSIIHWAQQSNPSWEPSWHSASVEHVQQKVERHDAPPPQKLTPVRVGSLVDDHPELRPVVIDGILRRGEIANIIAAPKVGKSFLGGNLAWCVATGMPWLGHDVEEGRVLIIDNELHHQTIAHRLYQISKEMMVKVEDHPDSIDVIPLRGKNLNIHQLGSRLDVQPGDYSLVLVDALYRTLPEKTSENDNAAMMAVYNRLDEYAREWDAAIGVIHHTSKGGQGEKSITDVGAGAGSISRAADTHIIIRPHEDPELAVMDCVTRSFKSPEPVSLRFTWPVWESVSNAPEVRKPGRQNKEAQAKADKQDVEALYERIPATKAIQQKRLFEQVEFGVSKCERLIGKLVSDSRVEIKRRRKKGGKQEFVFYSRTASDSGNDSGNDSGMV